MPTAKWHRFADTFENVYAAPSLQVPVYVVLGNHDWHTVANQTAELAYTAISKRWRMSDVNKPSESPNFYYLVQEVFTPATGGAPVTVDIVFIDTVILAGLSLDEAALNATTHKHDHARLPRMADLADPAAVELAWINKTMAESTADWLIVTGHCEWIGRGSDHKRVAIQDPPSPLPQTPSGR